MSSSLPTPRELREILRDDFADEEGNYHLCGYIEVDKNYKFAMLKDDGFDAHDFVLKVHCLRFFQYLFRDIRGHELFRQAREKFIEVNSYAAKSRDPEGQPLTSPRMVDIFKVLPRSILTEDELKHIEAFNRNEWTHNSLFESYILKFLVSHKVESINHHVFQIYDSIMDIKEITELVRDSQHTAHPVDLKPMIDQLELMELDRCTSITRTLKQQNR